MVFLLNDLYAKACSNNEINCFHCFQCLKNPVHNPLQKRMKNCSPRLEENSQKLTGTANISKCFDCYERITT